MAMNMNLVTQYLNQYTEHEKIYREYCEALRDENTLRAFAQQVTHEKAIEDQIILPELYPDSLPAPDYFCDENLFRRGPA